MIPPPLHTSEKGSFAHDTLRVRVPEILARTRRRLPPTPPDVNHALDELAQELRGGRLRGLVEEAADRPAWDTAVAPHLGRSWLDLPWFFAEAFFYRRLLEATGYFGRGPLAGVDPFAADKRDEWQPSEAPARCADMLARLPPGGDERLRAHLHGSLWGNRADLSYNVAQHLGSYAGDAGTDLLVDRTDQVIGFLTERPRARVVLIADNAGTELLMDLALVDHLLGACGVGQLWLHLKTHPTFVSDAMEADVNDGLGALRRSPAAALADRLDGHRRAGSLILGAHPFYTSSLHYSQLPADLRAELGRADLVILKGDANYRRLCSDAHWPPETPFAQVVDGFPAPVVALRTLKAEVVVGLPPGLAARLSTEDPCWMVDGRRGVVEARL